MRFAQWVGEQFAQGINFNSLHEAVAAFRKSTLCQHPETVFGECVACGHVFNVEGTFKVNPDKSRYLDARRS